MAAAAQHIRFDLNDRVARITLARPPLNILNIAMMREINGALEECARQNDLVAIVFDTAPETPSKSMSKKLCAKCSKRFIQSFAPSRKSPGRQSPSSTARRWAAAAS